VVTDMQEQRRAAKNDLNEAYDLRSLEAIKQANESIKPLNRRWTFIGVFGLLLLILAYFDVTWIGISASKWMVIIGFVTTIGLLTEGLLALLYRINTGLGLQEQCSRAIELRMEWASLSDNERDSERDDAKAALDRLSKSMADIHSRLERVEKHAMEAEDASADIRARLGQIEIVLEAIDDNTTPPSMSDDL
jgi:hypothetical protein